MVPSFITVRSSSTRLPNKCYKSFGDMTVIEHIIKRALHYGLDTIDCTTNESKDGRIVDIALSNNIKVFRGPTINKLQRWRDCCREKQC